MNGASVSKATLGRLPKYLQYLKSLPHKEDATISATAIAKELSLGDVQVRKDLAAVSGSGRPRVGYDRAKLIRDLQQRLGSERMTYAVLIGAGKLGRALLDYNGFEEFGVKVLASFDRDETILEASNKIFSTKDLRQFCATNAVKIGIITVGKHFAQEVCDQLLASGIKAIWNFAPCSLNVPEGVFLKNENLALSLAHLNNQLGEAL